MPVHYLRALTSPARSLRGDRHLAVYLTFVAGAVNAGGFLAVGQYTSHMSGIVSAMADNVALGQIQSALAALSAVVTFAAGAGVSAWLVNWGRRHDRHAIYAAPLLLEAALFLLFGLLGHSLANRAWGFVPLTVGVLCFTMGLQNAMVTKLSRAEIRTTHVTGLITDFGIELGKLAYWNRATALNARVRVSADRERLRILGTLVATFFIGGVAGAVGFARFGFMATVPLAAGLLLVAGVPLYDDLRAAPRP